MSLDLQLDTAAWRQHLHAFAQRTPGLVPVAKGNGYGFGLARLAQEASMIGPNVIAVGTRPEVAQVQAGGWHGDVVVLTPWSPADGDQALRDPHVIATLGRLDDLAAAREAAPTARVVLEVRTSMRRHGLLVEDLPRAVDALGEARALAHAALAARRAPLWLSHLSAEDYATLRQELDVATHLRVGTQLWLGAPGTRRTTARVLDLHPVRRGERIGYWQRRMPADGWVVVVSGGTANGVALEAPTSAHSLRQRAVSLATGSLAAAGLALSPYTLAGKKRFFVEPPHMQSSLVFLPGNGQSEPPVAIGDEVPVELRLTTASVDRIIG